MSLLFLLSFKFDSSVNLLNCLLIKVAPALFFKTAFLYLPFVYMIVSVMVLQCWDLTRSLGGVPCSSHWASLCWPPLWSGLSSALASRRRSNVSHIHVFDGSVFKSLSSSFCWPPKWWFPHLSLWTSEGFSIAHVGVNLFALRAH